MSAAARRTALLNELGAIVGAEHVVGDGADLLRYGADRTTRWPPAPLAALDGVVELGRVERRALLRKCHRLDRILRELLAE